MCKQNNGFPRFLAGHFKLYRIMSNVLWNKNYPIFSHYNCFVSKIGIKISLDVLIYLCLKIVFKKSSATSYDTVVFFKLHLQLSFICVWWMYVFGSSVAYISWILNIHKTVFFYVCKVEARVSRLKENEFPNRKYQFCCINNVNWSAFLFKTRLK